MAKSKELQLTGGQLEIMGLFWERGELGVAQAWKILAERRTVARNTVQTQITRLAERGWLRARVEGNAFYYRAARPQKFALTGLVRKLVDTAFEGSASGLVMALLEGRRISSEEAKRIREMIDRAERGAE